MPTPEARRSERLKYDHHDTYIWFHIGVWLVALGILIRGAPTSGVVADLSWGTQQMLGGCMFVGATLGIIGILTGTRVLRRDTLAKPLDLRFPYAWGAGGLIAVGVSMWSYFLIIAASGSLVGALSGGLSLAFGCMSLTLAWRFAKQIITRSRMRIEVTKQVLREQERGL